MDNQKKLLITGAMAAGFFYFGAQFLENIVHIGEYEGWRAYALGAATIIHGAFIVILAILAPKVVRLLENSSK